MAAFIGRQAQCNAFHFDFVGYSPARSDDSFLTATPSDAQQSTHYIWGLAAIWPLNSNVRLATEPFSAAP